MVAQNRLMMKAFTFEGAAPGANTDIFDEITPTETASAFRIGVSLATGSVFKMIATQGATTNAIKFNGGVALTALCGYTFTWPIRHSEGTTAITYNFQVETDGIIDWLSVEEVPGGVV